MHTARDEKIEAHMKSGADTDSLQQYAFPTSDIGSWKGFEDSSEFLHYALSSSPAASHSQMYTYTTLAHIPGRRTPSESCSDAI